LGLIGRVVSSSRCAKSGKLVKNFIFYFLSVVFIGFIFLIFKFFEVLFESFRILGKLGG